MADSKSPGRGRKSDRRGGDTGSSKSHPDVTAGEEATSRDAADSDIPAAGSMAAASREDISAEALTAASPPAEDAPGPSAAGSSAVAAVAAGIPLDATISFNGRRRTVTKSPTDFAVIGTPATLPPLDEEVAIQPLSARQMRVTTNEGDRDAVMDAVRDRAVAHHIYELADTGEEVVIDNRIILTLRYDDPQALQQIIEAFRLEYEQRMGEAHVLRVTEATGINPVKTANAISLRPEVAECAPQVLMPLIRFHGIGGVCDSTPAPAPSLFDSHRLYRQQWYLSAALMNHADVTPGAGIDAPGAWQMTMGSPDIVLAVIDDGFDLSHPAFHNKRIHPKARDFAVVGGDDIPASEGNDYHGTCVASVATASVEGGAMIGVAPGCTLLPIRIGFGPLAAPVDMLEVFRYASRFADVVNCSFGVPPFSEDPFPHAFRQAITELTRTGGRRGKGLVIVFAAGNDDAPTALSASQNVNGVKFTRRTASGDTIAQVPPGLDVFSGYPMTAGVIVAGAMSSRSRKTGYSNWGPHITVTAPSNNTHYIMRFIPADNPQRTQFVANYRGLGQVAATNRPGFGRAFEALLDDAATPDLRENYYTRTFGGTSGAAPIISGVAALMLSANPALTAEQVKQILMETADQDLDATLDLQNDPNVQGLSGQFVNGRSRFFGAGKVNARRAVERAQALFTPAPVSALPRGYVGAAPDSGTWPDFEGVGLSEDDTALINDTAPTDDPCGGMEGAEILHAEALSTGSALYAAPAYAAPADNLHSPVSMSRLGLAAQPPWHNITARHLRPRRRTIQGIMLHDTAGSGTHNDTRYLVNPGDGRVVSADFTVERDGSIWKLNPQLVQFCCLHAGRATRWRGLVNHQVNQATVGIEIVQKANLSLTPIYPMAQVRSVALLCAWLVQRFGLETADVTSHRAVITDGSRSDPRQFPFSGPNGFWALFWQALQGGV